MTQQPWRNAPQPAWGGGYPRTGYQGQWNGPAGFPPVAAPAGYGGRPGYGAPPGGYRPPPRRRSPLRTLFLALVVLALLALVGAVAANLAAPPSEVAYENTDYQAPPVDSDPPPLPYASGPSEVDAYLATNPFYGQDAVGPVDCSDLDPIQTGASDAELESHFTALTACLMAVWDRPVQGADFELPRPSVTVYGRKVTTRCGTSEVNAFYCSADQQIYYSNLLPRAIPAVTRTPWGVDIVMAHEFGHTLQARTGILVTAHLSTQNGSEQQQLVSSRRLETQADCLSGMFVRAFADSQGIEQSDVSAIEDTYRAIGDDTLSGKPNVQGDHGLARSRLYWGQQGLGNATISSCNTFVVPASAVR